MGTVIEFRTRNVQGALALHRRRIEAEKSSLVRNFDDASLRALFQSIGQKKDGSESVQRLNRDVLAEANRRGIDLHQPLLRPFLSEARSAAGDDTGAL